jgi:hypothetical protein
MLAAVLLLATILPLASNDAAADAYLRDSIRTWVWSGFYTRAEVVEMLGDIADEKSDVQRMQPFISSEFARKRKAEKTWPKVTDCDRLDAAFRALQRRGIIALQNAGMDISDGVSDVSEELARTDKRKVRGYCFYHFQDVERAVAGDGLSLAFGDLENDRAEKVRVGQLVVDVMRAQGFAVEWNGDPDVRILLPKFDWKRR